MRCYGLSDLLCGVVSPYDCEYLKKKKNACRELKIPNLTNGRVLRHAHSC